MGAASVGGATNMGSGFPVRVSFWFGAKLSVAEDALVYNSLPLGSFTNVAGSLTARSSISTAGEVSGTASASFRGNLSARVLSISGPVFANTLRAPCGGSRP